MTMLKEIMADFRSMNQDDAAMRKFGILLGSILIVFAGLILFRRGLPEKALFSTPSILILLGFLSFCLALMKPKGLKPVNSVMVIISLCVGYCITRVVLFVLFFGMFWPMGIILRLFGKDSMSIKHRKEQESYWIICPDEPYDQARCKRQF